MWPLSQECSLATFRLKSYFNVSSISGRTWKNYSLRVFIFHELYFYISLRYPIRIPFIINATVTLYYRDIPLHDIPFYFPVFILYEYLPLKLPRSRCCSCAILFIWLMIVHTHANILITLAIHHIHPLFNKLKFHTAEMTFTYCAHSKNKISKNPFITLAFYVTCNFRVTLIN